MSDTDVSPFEPLQTAAAATARLSSSKGKSPKAKTPKRMSHIKGNTRNTSTSPRKRLRVQSHYTSEENTSDTDIVPQSKLSHRLCLYCGSHRYAA